MGEAVADQNPGSSKYDVPNFAVKWSYWDLSPMLQQYVDYKKEYPDCLIFMQVGDFYECFFEDAETLSQTLNVTLTTRDKNQTHPIPMAGVPMLAVEGYLERLVDVGYSVAIVSQIGTASGKGMVERGLERIITPGVRVLGGPEGSGDSKIVVLVYPIQGEGRLDFALAYTDVDSGSIHIWEGISEDSLRGSVLKLDPAEVLLSSSQEVKVDRRSSWVRSLENSLAPIQVKFRDSARPHSRAQSRQWTALAGYSALAPGARQAVQQLLNYLDEVTVSVELPIQSILAHRESGSMSIDSTTRNTLELVRNSRGRGIEGTLFWALNKTVSPGGAATLKQWLVRPLVNRDRILERLDAVRSLWGKRVLRKEIRGHLAGLPAIHRIATRLDLNVVTPRELGAVRDAFGVLPDIRSAIEGLKSDGSSSTENPLLRGVLEELEVSKALEKLLLSKLSDSPPVVVREGNIFRGGVSEELDRLRTLRKSGKTYLLQLEGKERDRTGINSLKIKYNGVHGYFFEVTKANASKVPNHYVPKQTTTNASRFITEELKRLEREVLGAEDKLLHLERELYEEFKQELRPFTSELRSLSSALSTLDCLQCFAELADTEGFVEPEIRSGTELEIVQGRHPVIAKLLPGNFIPNDLRFGESAEDGKERVLILTGPNMGGKSTYLRQAGLIVIMAQVGCPVPAQKAVIGVVDRVFARIGSSDDLLEGESTFMVEMREASHIVANATSRSLLLVDEIGRGTATKDGLAIARGMIEWFGEKLKSRTLFATHFHELTDLAKEYAYLRNISVGVFEEEGQIVFSHQIQEGAADRSYGLEVARLAGLPSELLRRSGALLQELEESVPSVVSNAKAQTTPRSPQSERRQLDLFTVREREVPPADYEALRDLRAELLSVPLESLSPLDAFPKFIEILKKAREPQT